MIPLKSLRKPAVLKRELNLKICKLENLMQGIETFQGKKREECR